MPRSCRRSSTLRSESGKRTYSITAKRMISGLVLKYLNGECFVIRRGYETARPVSSSFCLTVPGRQFAAYLGLVPRQNSSGGKDRLGRISKMGNGYLRRLLVVGATSVTRRAPTIDTRTGTWVRSLLEHKPTRVVTVAIANKTARTAWALLSKGESYKAVPAI